MATFDISRVAFNPRKHYSSVRMQQGRVLTDDDWNENERIEDEILRRTQVDIIGHSGSPDGGFKIKPESFTTVGGFIDFDILPGTMYTGGIRLEMDDTEKFRLQKDWLQKNDNDYKVPTIADFPNGITEIFDLVYLETWQQPVSAVEDSSLFEAALGGPDTTARLRNTRRVKIFRNTDSIECPISWNKLKTEWESLHYGTINREDELVPDTNLKVSFVDSGESDDLCSPSVTGGYLGAENQAIRVQVTDFDHTTNKGFFTWGFDNAAPLYRISVSPDGFTVTMITEPKDQHHWPLTGQEIEILPWSAVLPNNEKIAEQTGFFSKVALSYNPDNPNGKTFTLDNALPGGFGSEWETRSDAGDLGTPGKFFYMKVWNRGSDIASPAEIPFTPGTSVRLGNTGLKVEFNGNDFISPDKKTGCYWVIAARPATPQSVVPWELTSTGISPHGVRFFYSPLAILKWTNDHGVKGEIIHDCRKHFHPLTELDCCCTFSVGDGVNSKGDFLSIQEAIDNLPARGGKICILPGNHLANINIKHRVNVEICGCGKQSVIRPFLESKEVPIVLIENSSRIRISDLLLEAIHGTVVSLKDDQSGVPSSDISICKNIIFAYKNAIHLETNPNSNNGNLIEISHNRIGMVDKTGGDVAIFCLGKDVLIERNRIILVPPRFEDPGDMPEDPDHSGDPLDPCARPADFYSDKFPLDKFNKFLLNKFTLIYSIAHPVFDCKTKSGIQIGGSSVRVKIIENTVIGGCWNGITLGHIPLPAPVPQDDDDVGPVIIENPAPVIEEWPSGLGEDWIKKYIAPALSLRDIKIENNTIARMGLSGIGVEAFFNLKKIGLMIRIDQLTIFRNELVNCANKLPTEISDEMLFHVGFGGVGLADVSECIIEGNTIKANGKIHLQPVCGVFILHGDAIDVMRNHITDNGSSSRNGPNGNRGGILIRFAIQKVGSYTHGSSTSSTSQPAVNFNEKLALMIHDNLVCQPLGQALSLQVMGNISILDNYLESQEIYDRNTINRIAGTVYIYNFGQSPVLSKLLTRILFSTRMSNKRMGTVRSAGASRNPIPLGNIMFSNNHVHLNLMDNEHSEAISSLVIISRDDLAFGGNQVQCTSSRSIISDVFLSAISIRTANNRFRELQSSASFSCISFGYMNTTLGNQSDRCILAFGSRRTPQVHFNDSNMVNPTSEICQKIRNGFAQYLDILANT